MLKSKAMLAFVMVLIGFSGAQAMATDLRASASLVLASLHCGRYDDC